MEKVARTSGSALSPDEKQGWRVNLLAELSSMQSRRPDARSRRDNCSSADRDGRREGVTSVCQHAARASLSTFDIIAFVAFRCLSAKSLSRQLRRHQPLGREHRSLAIQLIGAILILTSCLHCAAATGVALAVDPSNGRDAPLCSLTLPCKTIAYAISSRQATNVLLLNQTFDEPSILVADVAFVNITGTRRFTTIDCSRRADGAFGTAFTITNSSVAFSGITFQHCINFNASNGTGGALSAQSSVVTVSHCDFLNNSAQTGGAIGAISSALAVSSCFFADNTATCSNSSIACSAWGGAVGVLETLSVSLADNTFARNSVNLDLIGVSDSVSQAAAGGGCVSIMHNMNVADSRVSIDRNTFQSCSVNTFGVNIPAMRPSLSGVQYGNSFGGAVSIYFGLLATSALSVSNVTSSFTGNQCHNSRIRASVGVAGNSYGGCLSVHAGPWSVRAQGDSAVAAVHINNMNVRVIGNVISNCSCIASSTSTRGSFGLNSYGGGVSIVVGAYSYGRSSSTVSGGTIVTSSSYTISNNVLSACTAFALNGNSFGANAYGGGISLVVGPYSYINGPSSTSSVIGGTLVSSSIHIISNNTFNNCAASSTTSSGISHGANVYGGGTSIVVGAYSAGESSSATSGSTTVSNSSYTISSNTYTNCAASTAHFDSIGMNAYGGAVSIVVGAYSFAGSSSTVSGGTTISSSSYSIFSNTLTNCTALSSAFIGVFALQTSGANAYGGGMSLYVGAYSFEGFSSA